MLDAVAHGKKTLMNGLLSLLLVTGQHGHVISATLSDSKNKVRAGMPIGVQVHMTDPSIYNAFLEKFVEIAMPKLRDFNGFPNSMGNTSEEDTNNRNHAIGQQSDLPGTISLTLDAEAWQAFPEIEASYSKFPQLGSVGALQKFTISFLTTARSKEEARLLMSGFRIPITIDDPRTENTLGTETRDDEIHEV